MTGIMSINVDSLYQVNFFGIKEVLLYLKKHRKFKKNCKIVACGSPAHRRNLLSHYNINKRINNNILNDHIVAQYAHSKLLLMNYFKFVVSHWKNINAYTVNPGFTPTGINLNSPLLIRQLAQFFSQLIGTDIKKAAVNVLFPLFLDTIYNGSYISHCKISQGSKLYRSKFIKIEKKNF